MCWEISYLTNTRGQLNLSGQGRPIPGASPCQALGGRGRPEQPSVPQSQRQPAARFWPLNLPLKAPFLINSKSQGAGARGQTSV